MNCNLCLLFDADSDLDLSVILNASLNCSDNLFAFYYLGKNVIKFPTKTNNISRYSIPLIKADLKVLEPKSRSHDLSSATKAKVVFTKKIQYSNGIHIVNMDTQYRLKLLVEAVIYDSY